MKKVGEGERKKGGKHEVGKARKCERKNDDEKHK